MQNIICEHIGNGLGRPGIYRKSRRMEEAEEEEAAQLTAALQYTERESETAVFDTPETRDPVTNANGNPVILQPMRKCS